MRLIRTLIVFLYLLFIVPRGVSYYNKLDADREIIGEEAMRKAKYVFARKAASKVVDLTGSQVEVTGLEHIPKEGTVLFVANHQSYMDIPVMIKVIERPIGFIAKEDLGKIPYFDKWIAHLECVLISREDGRKALEAILKAAKLLKGGHNLVLFPEGTRSKDGRLNAFKAGSLKAAQKGNVSIVPVVLDGVREIMPRNSLLMGKASVKVTILPAIPAEAVKAMDTKELSFQVKQQIGQALGQTVTRDDGEEQNG